MAYLHALAGLLRGNGKAASMARVLALRSLAIGVNVLTGLLTASALGPAGRGELAAVCVAPQFLAGLAGFGLHASFIYNMKAEPGHEREYLGAMLILNGLGGIALAAIGWAVLPYWLAQYPPHTIEVGRRFLAVTPFTVTTWGLLAAAEARGWFGLANGTLYLQSLGTLLLLLALMALDALTPETAATAYMAPAIPVFLYFAWRIGRKVRPALTLRAPFPGRLSRYGLRFYGVEVLGTLSGTLDQIIIVAMLAPELVGIYAVALSLTRVLTPLQVAIASVLFPSIAARGTAEVVEKVAATLRVALPVTAGAALVLGLAGPFLLPFLYGPRFTSAVGPFRLLLLETVVGSSARILLQAYSGSGRPEWVTGFEAAGVVLSMTLMLALVPHFGLAGAACSALLASSARLACAVAGLRPVLGSIRPRLLLNWSDLQLGLRALRGPVVGDAAS